MNSLGRGPSCSQCQQGKWVNTYQRKGPQGGLRPTLSQTLPEWLMGPGGVGSLPPSLLPHPHQVQHPACWSEDRARRGLLARGAAQRRHGLISRGHGPWRHVRGVRGRSLVCLGGWVTNGQQPDPCLLPGEAAWG